MTDANPYTDGIFDLIEFRQATAEDINFIKNTWLTSLRLTMPREILSTTFYPEHEAIVGNLAKDTPCWIAADKEHPFYIYGWACGTMTAEGVPLLHYIFIRPEWRRKKLARALAEKIGWQPFDRFVVSHLTHFLKQRWFKNLEFNPYVLARYAGKFHEDT